jgi:hypothetical protein
LAIEDTFDDILFEQAKPCTTTMEPMARHKGNLHDDLKSNTETLSRPSSSLLCKWQQWLQTSTGHKTQTLIRHDIGLGQDAYLKQGIQSAVEVGVLQAVLSNQGEDSIEGKHAHQPPFIQAPGQEV